MVASFTLQPKAWQPANPNGIAYFSPGPPAASLSEPRAALGSSTALECQRRRANSTAPLVSYDRTNCTLNSASRAWVIGTIDWPNGGTERHGRPSESVLATVTLECRWRVIGAGIRPSRTSNRNVDTQRIEDSEEDDNDDKGTERDHQCLPRQRNDSKSGG